MAAAARLWLEGRFGNPSSSRVHGQQARQAITQARKEVAALIGAHDDKIVFTGSATEANNLASPGVARALPDKRHLVISAVEHPSVMQPALHLRNPGWDVTIASVDRMRRVAASNVATDVATSVLAIVALTGGK